MSTSSTSTLSSLTPQPETDTGFIHFKVTKVVAHDGKELVLQDLKLEIILTTYNKQRSIVHEKKFVPKFKDGHYRFDAHNRALREMKIRVILGDEPYGHWTCSLDTIMKRCIANQYISTVCLLTKRKASLYMNVKFIKNADEVRAAERHFRPELIKGHCLVPKVFRSIAQCVNCRGLLWGFTLRGYECSRCGISLHKHCARRLSLLRCRPLGSRLHDLTRSSGTSHSLKPLVPKRFKDFCYVDGNAIRKTHNCVPKVCSKCKVKVHAECENLLPPNCGLSTNQSKNLIRQHEINYYALKAAENVKNANEQTLHDLESL